MLKLFVAAVVTLVFLTQSSTASSPPAPSYGDPGAVTIQGYSGDAMEPIISPDGRYLALWWLEHLADLRTITVFGVIDLGNGQSETVAGTPDGLIPRAVTWAGAAKTLKRAPSS